MNCFRQTIFCLFLLTVVAAQAQLVVTVLPPKTVGQKALVKLAMKNSFSEGISSARAVCFLLDEHGRMIGQSVKWVIGQNKTGLEPGATNSFNFVITSQQPFTTTNLTAKVTFIRVVLEDGKLANMLRGVTVTTAAK